MVFCLANPLLALTASLPTESRACLYREMAAFRRLKAASLLSLHPLLFDHPDAAGSLNFLSR